MTTFEVEGDKCSSSCGALKWGYHPPGDFNVIPMETNGKLIGILIKMFVGWNPLILSQPYSLYPNPHVFLLHKVTMFSLHVFDPSTLTTQRNGASDSPSRCFFSFFFCLFGCLGLESITSRSKAWKLTIFGNELLSRHLRVAASRLGQYNLVVICCFQFSPGCTSLNTTWHDHFAFPGWHPDRIQAIV